MTLHDESFCTIRRALLSVSDKTGLVELARTLVAHGTELISTGGTAVALRAAGIPVRDVSDVTGFPEMMDGRVKTLHPAIHGALLGLRSNPEHIAAMRNHGIEPIDLICVNLYPFEETIARENVTEAEATEQIDIGGPAMIRSASKNWRDVAVVTQPALYDKIRRELNANMGALSGPTRKKLAVLAFMRTALYDTAVFSYLQQQLTEQEEDDSEYSLAVSYLAGELEARAAVIPADADDDSELAERDIDLDIAPQSPSLNGSHASKNGHLPAEKDIEVTDDDEVFLDDTDALDLVKLADLRYGENPHQIAALYECSGQAGLAQATVIGGKEMSFNNYLDADAAWHLVCDFDELACAIIKHTNPAGVALGSNVLDAYKRALQTDPLSAFGGIVAFNREVDGAAARAVIEIFTEVIIAPGYTDEAAETLLQKKNLRILQMEGMRKEAGLEYRQISGGFLVQSRDQHRLTASDLRVVTRRAPTSAEIESLLFAWTVCKHTKSNAIVYANAMQTVGVGAGQMSRVDSVKLAATRAQLPLQGSVMASDAFFPFRDGVDEAASFGITAVIQPGGSMRDQEVIAAADEKEMAMVFTDVRHFRH